MLGRRWGCVWLVWGRHKVVSRFAGSMSVAWNGVSRLTGTTKSGTAEEAKVNDLYESLHRGSVPGS